VSRTVSARADRPEAAASAPSREAGDVPRTAVPGPRLEAPTTSVAQARNQEVSAHCAPALHAPVAAAVPNLRHVEWFAEHARLEPLLADGVPPVIDGALRLDPAVAGHGLTITADAERWRVR